ncbi:Chaperone protein DnaJ [Linum perenne]
MADKDTNRNKSDPQPQPSSSYPEKGEGMKLWGILVFGVIGATATTIALTRSQSSWKGGKNGSFRSAFQEEARRRYNRRMQEEYEEEMERVERIRRMQSVFNRERNKYKRSYESWKENDQGAYHQHFQRDDWYWKADPSFRDQSKNFRRPPRDNIPPLMSHHYLVLGLDRSRTTAYTDAEIKTAFRKKAKEFHPDQNQTNKEAAEAKFKQVMTSYEAIKEERKNMR